MDCYVKLIFYSFIGNRSLAFLKIQQFYHGIYLIKFFFSKLMCLNCCLIIL